MRKQDIIDELASLTDTIENTVDEMNKKLKPSELKELVTELIWYLKVTQLELEHKLRN